MFLWRLYCPVLEHDGVFADGKLDDKQPGYLWIMTKILLISFENDSDLLLHVASELEDRGHSVFQVDGAMSSVSHFSREYHHSSSTIKPALDSFYSGILNLDQLFPKVLHELVQLEQSLRPSGRTILNHLRAEPNLFDDHHARKPYYCIPRDYRLRLAYFWTYYKWFSGIVESFQPDLCFCIETNYLLKYLSSSLSHVYHYRFLSIASSRILDFMLPLDASFKPYKLNHIDVKQDCFALDSLSDEPCSNRSLTYLPPEPGFAYPLSVRSSLRHLLLNGPQTVLSSLRHSKSRVKRRLLNATPSYHIYNSPTLKSIIGELLPSFRRLALALNPPHFLNYDEALSASGSNRYIFITLHVLPESSTLSLSQYYYEEDLIRYISSLLPVDCRLLIKENIHMIGHRDRSFYSRLLDLGNVDLLAPDVPPIRHTELSNIFISLSGTSLLEALIAKHVYVACVGNPEFLDLVPEIYRGIPGVTKLISDLHSDTLVMPDSEAVDEYVKNVASWNIRWSKEEKDYAFYGVELPRASKTKLSSQISRLIEAFSTAKGI